MRDNSVLKKIAAVREVLGGASLKEVSKKYHCTRQSLYTWTKKYRENPDKARTSLKNAYKSGRKHHKSLSWQAEKLVLDLVIKEPDLGLRKFRSKLADAGFKVSEHGIYNILVRHELQTKELRHRFSFIHPVKTLFASSIVPAYRVKAVEEYIKEGKKISQVCRLWNISRPTFYSWLKRYKSAIAEGGEGANTAEALSGNYKTGFEHHRSSGESARELVRDIVARNPKYSVHKIYAEIPRVDGKPVVGHHGIQNILAREDLNTFEKRLRFAQGVTQVPEAAIAPLYSPEIPLYKLRHLIAHFKTVPKLLLTDPKRGLPYAAGIFSTFLLLFLWIRLLFTTPNASPFGLFFSSIALTFGLFFFIYSMKYYITVLLVLRLAQGGGSNADQGRWLGRLGFLGELGKALGLDHKAKGRGVNPLTLNLDKIILRSHPFVSIHVALYNEKRVVERLIRACESQEYYEEVSQVSQVSQVSKGGGLAAYEVIIADDSTDETTEICKELLSSGGRILDRTRKDEEMEVYVSSPPVGSSLPVIKLIHRFSRSGFKGAALQRALENTNPKAVYISVFDADFVPYPDTLSQFVKTFQELNGSQASSGGGNEAGIDEGLRQTSPNTETSFVTDNRIAAVQGYPEESLSLARSTSSPRDVGSTGQASGTNSSMIAAVQGYQWHVLNKSQTWITRGVRTEYAGSYVIERAGEEIYGGLKQIAGSVYAIRADILRQFGWGTSITEDFELTLRLYEKGYKVAFTPYIQAPAEAVSTIKRLVRQRMRWAEGASYNIKVMLPRLLWGRWEEAEKISNYSNYSNQTPNPKSQLEHSHSGVATTTIGSNVQDSIAASSQDSTSLQNDKAGGRVWVKSGLTRTEKLEFAYLAPYYLQAAFFVIGTFSWFISEAILGSRLPFWTAALGWSLVFTNILALPLMNIVGLFLEESDERDYIGILSFIALSYIVVPFQAYAAIKGFIESEEGPWFRTPKTGMITDTFGRSGFSKFFGNMFGKKQQAVEMSRESWGSKGSWGIGAVMPALAFRPLAVNNFRVRPRYMRYAGNLVLGLVIAVTVGMSMIAPFVPTSRIYAQKPAVKTIGESNGQKEGESGTAQSKEEDLTVKGEEITKSRLLVKTTEDNRKIEYVFSKEPVVRVKIDGYEIEFETESIGGREVRPKISRIYGEGQVVYEEAIEGVDIKYSLNGELITEEFILKNKEAAEAVGDKITQNIRTVGVKVVSPNPQAFGFYTESNKELFKLSQPFAKDDDGLITNDLSLSLDKPFDYAGGYRLTKTIGSAAQEWLNSSIRAYPVSIDPSIIVTGGVDDSETTYGGLQRKLAYVSSNWYAFYNCDANPCTSTEGKNGVFYQKSANGTSWGGYVNVNSGDTDDFSPSISVSGTTIIIAWLDNSTDEIEIKGLDTSSDTLTGLCDQGLDQGTIDTTTFMVTVAAVSATEAVVAYSDTSSDTEVDIFDVTAISGGTCTATFTDVSPGNITFGSGITGSDRPVVFALSSTKVGMVFQDGDLSYSELDVEAEDWTKNNLTLGAVTDSVYSVTSDQAATPTVWILSANISDATDTNFYICCTTDFATSTIDADVGAAGDDNESDVDMYCPAEGNCKIVYTDDIDTSAPRLMFVDCNDTTCSAPTITQLDADIGAANDTAGPSIYCEASDNCKVVAGNDVDGASGDLLFYDCISDEDCSSNVVGTIDTDIDAGTGTVILHTAVYCPADDDCKVVYNDNAATDFDFVDCANTACSSATLVTVDSGAAAEPKSDISCATGAADCKLVYHDSGTSDFTFVDCTAAAACATVFDVDGTVGATTGQVPSSVWCPASDGTDCRVAFGAQDLNDFHIVDCGSTACSASNTITTVDGNGGADATNDPTISMDCLSVSDCKVVYVGDLTASSQNLYILDCDATACTTGSVIEIGSSARFGASIKCLTSTNCKVAYYGGGSGGTPTLVFLDCDVTNCFPSSTDVTTDDPWQSDGSNIETVTLTYRSDNSSLYANIIQDASDQAYYKTTPVSSISWSSQTSWGFTAGQLNEISSPESISAEAQMGVVLNQTDANGNFEFATVPENIIYLALLVPLLYRIYGKRRCRGRPVMKC